jgi:hypothetical protein
VASLQGDNVAFDKVALDNVLFDIEARIVRSQILAGEPRIDGRDTRTVRQIEIRNGVLLLLSSKKVEDLASMEQKNRLRDEIREAANKPLGIETPVSKPAETAVVTAAPPVGAAHVIETPKPAAGTTRDSAADSGVLEVLLTSFVIQ